MLFWPIFGIFWCPVVTLVTFSSYLSNFLKEYKKKQKNPKKNPNNFKKSKSPKQGWAIPNQNSAKLSVSPCFARVRFRSPVFCPFLPIFCPNSPVFCPVSPRFRPNSPGFGFVRFCPNSPGFVRIRSSCACAD